MPHRVDLHIHSCYSRLDGMMSPRAIVKLADRLGYDGIAVTDHYTYDGAVRGTLAAKRLAEHRGLVAWTGVEYHVTEGEPTGHVLVYFREVDQVPPRGLTLSELLDHARDEDLTVIHPHPFGYAGIQAPELMHAADHVEINGSYGEHPVNRQVRETAAELGITGKLVANSDAHARGQMGSAYTEVETLASDLPETLATTVGHALATPRRSWGRAAKIARMIAQPIGLAMNGVQRLATRVALKTLPSTSDPADGAAPASTEA